MVSQAELHDHFVDLSKLREDRLQQLKEQQTRVQTHEHSLSEIYNTLDEASQQLQKAKERLDDLVTCNVWVTAHEHQEIHEFYEQLAKEYTIKMEIKNQKCQSITDEAKKAQTHASHLIGIERAMVCLKKQISLIEQQEKHRLRSSSSIKSFISLATKKTMLRKWFKPARIAA
jgi:enamine deaminase RidA (YjgF/YER057c/UK114 family)